MTQPATITILGLGPGNIQHLTLEARSLLTLAAQQGQQVFFRTLLHPTLEPLQADLPTLRVTSFDQFYEESDNWESLYLRIAEELCNAATQQPVIYAVPGHPLIGEISVQHVLRLAHECNFNISIVAGLSFIEPVCTLLNLDPFNSGIHIADATHLAGLQSDEVSGHITPTVPLLIVQVYNRRLASQVKLALSECYPDDWSVQLVRAAGVDSEAAVHTMPLYELDRNMFANHLSTLYVPPVDAMSARRTPEALRSITMRLRREPDGCPWDRQQTHQTLTRYLLEETYEVVEALEEQDPHKLAEELGDLLLQIYLHAEIARQDGTFTIGDVLEHINNKLVRRHPHVFGDARVDNAEQVTQNWAEIKRQERALAGQSPAYEGILARIPQSSPALTVSQEYQKRALKAGFEFSALEQLQAKVLEELQELQQATSPAEQLDEFGDLLFILVKWALWHSIDAETALRQANRKFRQRFETMESFALQQERELSSYSLSEWQALWQRAKQHLRPASDDNG